MSGFICVIPTTFAIAPSAVDDAIECAGIPFAKPFKQHQSELVEELVHRTA